MVIAIIGLLASIVLAAVDTARQHAVEAETTENAQAFDQAINLYYNDHGTYPSGQFVSGTSSWSTFQTALQPYLGNLHQDNSYNVFYIYDGALGGTGVFMNGSGICDWSGITGYMFIISGASPGAETNDAGVFPYYYEFLGGDAKSGNINYNPQHYPYDYCQ